jgi:putative nucleotidyltransferase with HDIG domain
MHLYGRGHPAREQALDEAWRSLDSLLRETPRPAFTVLGDLVAFDDRLVHGLRSWSAGPKLAAAGIERIEFTWPVPRTDFEAFIETAAAAIDTRTAARSGEHPSIRFGPAALTETLDLQALAAASGDGDLDALLEAEFEAMDFVLQEVAGGHGLQRTELETIVSSLLLSVLSAEAFLPPLLRLKDFDQYTAAHSLNVAVLSMSLAEFSGYPREQVRAIGMAGVLHDIGKVRTPRDILVKTGVLTAEDRRIIQEHPRDGARIILEAGQSDLDLAAVVAFEHHIWYDGRGYPAVRPPRACHPASNLLHVCDVYDAMATDRPYRPAWPEPKILDVIRANSGTEFDPFPTAAFLRMMAQRAGRLRTRPEAGTLAPA